MKQSAAIILLITVFSLAKAQQSPRTGADTTIPMISHRPQTIDSSTREDWRISGDTAKILTEVVVRGYENYSRLIDVPAPVSVFTRTDMNRFSNQSLVPVLNTAPGVRMEERSPGSYRLNIRGSSLRSPFGVRNVKVYYNNIPYTDPGGNTFLNQVGFYNVGSVEVIKGPGSSLYGAGTGGVILLNSEPGAFQRGATVDFITGSFGMNNFHVNVRGGSEDLNHSINYQYQENDGYRVQTRMERKVASWDGYAKIGEKGVLRAHFLQGDLFYETPGALNAAEFAADPKAARPRVGQTPGAEEARASINQRLFLAGLSYTLIWNDKWQNTTSMYGAFSRLINPTTRNYERRTEPHYGSRTVLQYKGEAGSSVFTWHGGIEAQKGIGASKVYRNVAGNPDSLLSDDEIESRLISLFTQATFETKNNWIFTGGISLNILDVELIRLSRPVSVQSRTYNNELAPRVAVLKKLQPWLSAYGSVSKGFSPPTNAELLPSTGVISTALEAERGTNYELGLRGNTFSGRLHFDVNAFYFRLNNTIAQRRDASGGDFFVNAGSTNQKGLETFVSYRVLKQSSVVVDNIRLWASHTWHDFKYSNFQKVTDDTVDLSGKRLPSIPRHFIAAGADIILKLGFYGNLSYYYSDRLPLNDANTDYASSYNLLSARIGYRKQLTKRFMLDVFGTGDNLFDVKYSLGNDINAFGGRYYNAAPERNFGIGATMRYLW